MSRNSRNAGARQNEYFVPRDGIDREVISADICRYLGNDALVRPGQYEDPETRQIVQGYYITAYRNLTTAMIDDLKADSARWDNERRAQTSRNSAPGGHYRSSETHQFRQQSGPTTDGPYQSDPYARETANYDGPRYPGTGSHGYSGASAPYSSSSAQHQAYSSSNSYGYQQQAPAQQDPRYSNYSQAPPMDQRYASSGVPSPYVAQGTNQNRRYQDDPYSSSMMSSSLAANQAPIYATSGPSASGYPATSYQQQFTSQIPSPANPQFQNLYPTDSGYGRASPSGQTPQQQQGFPPQAQQYESSTSRASVPPTSATTSTAGSTKRRSERDDDRHQRHPRR